MTSWKDLMSKKDETASELEEFLKEPVPILNIAELNIPAAKIASYGQPKTIKVGSLFGKPSCESEETEAIRSEEAECCSQRLICLQKQILSNPELCKIIYTESGGKLSIFSSKVFTMAMELYEMNTSYAKTRR